MAERDDKGRFIKAGEAASSAAGAIGAAAGATVAASTSVSDALGDLTGLLGSLGAAAKAAGGPLTKVTATLPGAGTSAPAKAPALPAAVGAEGAAIDKMIGKRKALQEAVGGSMGNMLSAAQQLGGPLGGIASKVQNISSLFGRVPPHVAATLIMVTALAAAVTALVATVYKLGETAIDVVGKLSLMKSVLGALHSSSAVGANITALVTSLSTKLPFATEQIAGWAKSLSMVARNGKQLESMIRAVASAQALMGDSGASAAQSMLETLGRGGAAAASLIATLKSGTPESKAQLAAMGLKTIDLARALGVTEQQFRRMKLSADQMNAALQKALAKKGAGPLGELMLQWPNLIQKVREGFLSLFDKLGPAVKPFMVAVQKLFAEFGRGGSAIKGIKPMITAFMTAVFQWATMAVNAATQLVKWLSNAQKGSSGLLTVGNVLRGVWLMVSVAWRLFSVVAGPAIALLKLAAFAVMWLVGNVLALAAVVGAVSAKFDELLAPLRALGGEASAAGSAFIDGLVGGIMAGIGRVADAARAVGAAAENGVKSILGIHSPSTVMMEHGEDNIAGAQATGMERGTKKVAKAAKGMGAASVGDGEGGGGGGRSITFKDCTFNGTDEGLIRRAVMRALEALDGEAGAQPVGAT